MPRKAKSNVDVWLERETPHVRAALENASRHFDEHDALTVNTLEAIYGRESSFGILMRKRGIKGAAGHFHLEKKTAEAYGLTVTKDNDPRFDIDDASTVAARYLKDLDRMSSRPTTVADTVAIPIKNVVERKSFVLAAYNGGQGRIAKAQRFARQAGKDPRVWNDVKRFLEVAGATAAKAKEIREFLEKVLAYELEFSQKSSADKRAKAKKPKEAKYQCTDGRWRTIDDRPVMICG